MIECLWIKLAELIPIKSERGAMGPADIPPVRT